MPTIYLRLCWRPRVVNISARNLEKYWNLSNRSLEFPVFRFCLFHELSILCQCMLIRCADYHHSLMHRLLCLISTAQHMIGLWPSFLNFCWYWKNVWKNRRNERARIEKIFFACETRCVYFTPQFSFYVWNIKNFMMIVCEESSYQMEELAKYFAFGRRSLWLRRVSWLRWMRNEFLIFRSARSLPK